MIEYSAEKYKLWAEEHWDTPQFDQSVEDMLMVPVNNRGKVGPKPFLMDAVVEAVTEHIVDLIKGRVIVYLLSGKLAVSVLTRLVDGGRTEEPGWCDEISEDEVSCQAL